MSDPFVAEIRMFGFNFAPTGWAQCNGQLLPISQNTALFSLLGTMYGGDGKSTFALPNLEGSTPLMWGQSKGGSLYDEGQTGGEDFVTLLDSEMPVHNHFVKVSTQQGDVQQPTASTSIARPVSSTPFVPGTNPVPPFVPMALQSLTPAGGSLPHNNLMPYLTVNFCIAMQGIFPPRT
jgi:microcystin-dependent protein